MSKGEFVFDWVKRLKFKQDPFDNVKNPERFLSGYEKEKQKINLFILERYKFGTISGDEGTGKTIMLRWIDTKLDRHRNKIKVAYIRASKLKTERDLIEALIDPLLNVYDRLTKVSEKLRLEELGKFLHSKLKGGKHMLILLDDIGKLPKRYIPLFKYFFNQQIKIQLIVTGTSAAIRSSGILSIYDKDELKLSLKGLTYDEMLWLLEKRIKHYGGLGIFPFEPDLVKKLYSKSENNPKKFLEFCRERAIKLSLDEKYMKKQYAKLAELRKLEMAEQQKQDEKKVISIKLGKKEELVKKEDREEILPAPDLVAQREMISEFVEQKPIKKEEKPKEAITPQEFETLSNDMKKGSEPKEDFEVIKPEPVKISRKEKKENNETEELLQKLAEEFEN